MEEINETQQLMFELIKRASFNAFDGKNVVADLLDYRHFWQAVTMCDDGLMVLRDMHRDFWHADTLYILATPGREDNLLNLASGWDADEVDWLDPEKAGRMLGEWSDRTRKNPRLVLRLWWD